MAVPLTRYLVQEAEYRGIEVRKRGVRWCQRRVTTRFPNFRFQRIDVYNGMYNRRGKTMASELRFPFEDVSFDFVNVSSVFTHMLPADVEHYLSEIGRVLRPNGRALLTFFLLNGASLEAIEAKQASLDPLSWPFKYPREGFRTDNWRMPEKGVAYDEEFVRRILGKAELGIREPIHYGGWSGRIPSMSFQDVIVVEKGAISPP